MNIQKRRQSEVDILDIEGEIDFHSSPQVRDQFSQIMDQKDPKIIINLKSVTYIDSSGLATFVEALQKMNRNNGKLILSEIAPSVRSVFEIAKLDSVFTLSLSSSNVTLILPDLPW